MRHHADVLVVIKVLLLALLGQNSGSVLLGRLVHHVESCVLGVLSKVALNAFSMALVTEREGLEVVVEAKLGVRVRLISL